MTFASYLRASFDPTAAIRYHGHMREPQLKARTILRSLLPAAACAALLSASLALAGSSERGGSGPMIVYNRFGGSAAVANNYDGSNYSIRFSQFARNGTITRDQNHVDGYQELVRSVSIDDDGGIYVVGIRYWQGGKYFWALKYNSSGRADWEWSDNRPGCDATDLAINGDGESWIAGQCAAGPGRALRLVHLDSRGYASWARDYDGVGSASVTGLNVDSGNRVALTAVSGPQVITIAVDPQGRQLTTY